MVSLENISASDLCQYQDLFKVASITMGWDPLEAVKVTYNGRESFLFYMNNVFMRFAKEDKVRLNVFQVDGNGKVVAFTKNVDGQDYQVMTDDDRVCVIDERKRQHILQLRKNEDESLDCNGLIDYVQYDTKTDERVLIRTQQHVYDSLDKSKIYEAYLKEPFYISYEDNCSKRDRGLILGSRKYAYYRMDFDVYFNKWQYDLATLGEYGIGAVMANNTISLQNNKREFSRFYRVLFSVGEYATITGFPFSTPYKKEDLDKMIEEYGFDKGIKSLFINLYNERMLNQREFQEIVDEYRLFMGREFVLRKG